MSTWFEARGCAAKFHEGSGISLPRSKRELIANCEAGAEGGGVVKVEIDMSHGAVCNEEGVIMQPVWVRRYVPSSSSCRLLLPYSSPAGGGYASHNRVEIGFVRLTYSYNTHQGTWYLVPWCALVYLVRVFVGFVCGTECLPYRYSNKHSNDDSYSVCATSIPEELLNCTTISSGGAVLLRVMIRKYTQLKHTGTQLFSRSTAVMFMLLFS